MTNFKNILFVALVCFLVSGCVSKYKADIPLYPQASENQPHATLEFYNSVTSEFSGKFLYVEVDGFSPTAYQYLPNGTTVLRLSPGSHEIKHLQRAQGIYYFNPVTTTFQVEAGKQYTMAFGQYSASVMRQGYSISYMGWSDEVTAQWPDKNIIANPLW